MFRFVLVFTVVCLLLKIYDFGKFQVPFSPRMQIVVQSLGGIHKFLLSFTVTGLSMQKQVWYKPEVKSAERYKNPVGPTKWMYSTVSQNGLENYLISLIHYCNV